MRATCFVGDLRHLAHCLTAPTLLSAYQETLAAEMPGLADRGMAAHLRRMATLAAAASADPGAVDPGDADSLRTDVFAVACWQGWELPVVARGEVEVDPAAARGLAGRDRAPDGAGLWVLGPDRLAFARVRTADPAQIAQRGS
jgi:hypothetical protein